MSWDVIGDPREHNGESDAQFAKRLREAARNETQPAEGPAPAPPPRSSSPPERIGPFRILSVLGEGGMGIVYLAQQEKPVRRRVALKVVKLGMDSRQVLARFEAERQALAMMNHANVSKVFDAGTTETGPTNACLWARRRQGDTGYGMEHDGHVQVEYDDPSESCLWKISVTTRIRLPAISGS